MIEIHLGNREAIKILKRLRLDKTPVLLELCNKIESAVLQELEGLIDANENPKKEDKRVENACKHCVCGETK